MANEGVVRSFTKRLYQTLSGVDLFFAWFNKGTSLVKLERYQEAAEAFDTAYQLYAELDDDDAVRPYRITWYQSWPYWAYYYSGRYQDVVNFANFTFSTIDELARPGPLRPGQSGAGPPGSVQRCLAQP